MSYQFSNEEISPKRSIKRRSSPRKVLHISDDVQEDIDNLLENVPEVKAVFTVLNKIGSGTFSSVYVAKLKNYPDVTERFALKHIIPTSHPSRIESELKCLQEIGGSQNVMGVEACIRHKDHVVIVMPYFHHDKFQDYVRDVRIDEVKDYMKNLFLSLKSVHDHNMIHRDVKPSNFLVNRKKRLYSLVDFGLAQKCAMKKPERSTHVPTPSVHPDKSQIKSSQSTENVNKRLPLSPRQAKIIDNGKCCRISTTEEMSYQFSNEEISPKRSIKRRSSPRKVLHISDDVQEDIDNLLENVPEVKAVFTVLNKIGSGTFSSVYVAKLKNYPDVTERFALKHIIPTSHPSRIESELKCLQEIGGSQNVMGVEACIRHKDHVVIVMPYFHHDKFQDYVRDVRIDEVKDYMKNLFLSLKSVHDHNMIHRDVKPSNFLVNRKKRLYSLVDFGLAQKCAMKKPERSTHVPTPSVHPDKSQIKSSQSTENVNKRLPLSPRQAKIIDNGKSTANSPRKRKLVFDAQERNESPSKRRFSKNDDKAITSCDSSMNKENPTDNPKHLTSTVAFNNASKKSPRRQLLMKRAGGIDGGGHSGVMVSSSGKSMYKSVAPSACQCFGKPIVCTICLSRMNQQAPRAGTPGFRSPEVLIKCPDQTMAIDVWSAGVIFLSLLSGRYPFFKADDDMSALAQIISVIGSQEMKDAAKSYGKEIIMSPMVPAVDLRVMCLRLRGCLNENNKVKAESSKSNWIHLPSSVWDLLAKALDPNPITRITAAEALKHPYLANS